MCARGNDADVNDFFPTSNSRKVESQRPAVNTYSSLEVDTDVSVLNTVKSRIVPPHKIG